jgi:hypothetical protein
MTHPHHSAHPSPGASTRRPAAGISPCIAALNNAGDAPHPRPRLRLVGRSHTRLDELIRPEARAGRHGPRRATRAQPRLPAGFGYVEGVPTEDLIGRALVRRRDISVPPHHPLPMRPAQDALGLTLSTPEPLGYLRISDEAARARIDVRIPIQDRQGAAIPSVVFRQAQNPRDAVLRPAEERADVYKVRFHKSRSVS